MKPTIDIGSYNSPAVASKLSNFHPYQFNFHGTPIASMEGLLQSFKMEDKIKQIKCCGLVGSAAKNYGRRHAKDWTRTGKLYWCDTTFARDGLAYFLLLCQAYFQLYSTNPHFRAALDSTAGYELRHSIGRKSCYETILTELEFVSILTHIRDNKNIQSDQVKELFSKVRVEL